MITLAASLTISVALGLIVGRWLHRLSANDWRDDTEAERAGVFYHGSSEDSKARYVDLFGDSSVVVERGRVQHGGADK